MGHQYRVKSAMESSREVLLLTVEDVLHRDQRLSEEEVVEMMHAGHTFYMVNGEGHLRCLPDTPVGLKLWLEEAGGRLVLPHGGQREPFADLFRLHLHPYRRPDEADQA